MNRFLTRWYRSRAGLLARLVSQVAFMWCVLWPQPAEADDFARDKSRLEDGLRSPGFAQGIAGVTSTLVVVLVNGAEIGRTLIQKPTKDGEKGEEKQLVLQVLTRDKAGKTCTELDQATGEPVYVQACVIDAVKGGIDAATGSIQFTLSGGENAVALTESASQGGWRAASVAASQSDTTPEFVTVYVSATIEGQMVSAPVKLTIKPGYEAEFF